jgi:hypothetical protein
MTEETLLRTVREQGRKGQHQQRQVDMVSGPPEEHPFSEITDTEREDLKKRAG